MDFRQKGKERKSEQGRQSDGGEQRCAPPCDLHGQESKSRDEKTDERRGHDREELVFVVESVVGRSVDGPAFGFEKVPNFQDTGRVNGTGRRHEERGFDGGGPDAEPTLIVL